MHRRSSAAAITLLDVRRSSNLEIMLSNIKMDYAELVDAILGLKVELLPSETVEQLQRYLPTTEERELLSGYVEAGGDPDGLGKAEQFFLAIIKIPRLQGKLSALEFKMGYDECQEWVHKVLDGIQQACTEILSSSKLRKMLQAVLIIGNSLNEGTKKQSKGFKLASLLKLRDTKSVDGKTTLLHFLVAHIEQHHDPAVLDVQEELIMAPFAAGFTFPMVDKEVVYLQNGVKALEMEIAASVANKESEQLRGNIEEFHGKSASCLEDTLVKVTATKRQFLRVADFFGEEVGKHVDGTEPERFFTTLNTFLTMINEAQKDRKRIGACSTPTSSAKAAEGSEPSAAGDS